MAVHLQITGWDGGDIDLNGTSSCMLANQWSPNVATRNTSGIGLTYNDVVEAITVRIHGTDVDDTLEILNNITAALEQAARWSQGDAVDAILLEYQPNDSTLAAPVSAPVLAGTISLNPMWDVSLQNQGFADATITLTRRGMWLGALQTATSGTSGDVSTAVFSAEATLPAPTKVTLSGVDDSFDRLAIITNNSDLIEICDLSDFTPYTTPPPTYGRYWWYDSSVNRLKFEYDKDYGDPTESATYWVALPAAFATTRRVGVFVMARAYFSAFTLWCQISNAASTTDMVELQKRIIPADEGLTAYSFGIITTPLYAKYIRFYGVARKVDPLNNTYLLISKIAVVDLDNPANVHVISVPCGNLSLSGTNMRFDHRALTHSSPLAYLSSTGTTVPNIGSAYLEMIGTDVAVTQLGGSATTQATRLTPYLIPS